MNMNKAFKSAGTVHAIKKNALKAEMRVRWHAVCRELHLPQSGLVDTYKRDIT